jgi:hypothetical protein
MSWRKKEKSSIKNGSALFNDDLSRPMLNQI